MSGRFFCLEVLFGFGRFGQLGLGSVFVCVSISKREVVFDCVVSLCVYLL